MDCNNNNCFTPLAGDLLERHNHMTKINARPPDLSPCLALRSHLDP